MLTKFEWTPKKWEGPFQYRNDDLGQGSSDLPRSPARPWTAHPSFPPPFAELMMLPTDLALMEDPSFRPHVEAYADDQDLFYADFSKAFAKLIELGVKRGARPVRSLYLSSPPCMGKVSHIIPTVRGGTEEERPARRSWEGDANRPREAVDAEEGRQT